MNLTHPQNTIFSFTYSFVWCKPHVQYFLSLFVCLPYLKNTSSKNLQELLKAALWFTNFCLHKDLTLVKNFQFNSFGPGLKNTFFSYFNYRPGYWAFSFLFRISQRSHVSHKTFYFFFFPLHSFCSQKTPIKLCPPQTHHPQTTILPQILQLGPNGW